MYYLVKKLENNDTINIVLEPTKL